MDMNRLEYPAFASDNGSGYGSRWLPGQGDEGKLSLDSARGLLPGGGDLCFPCGWDSQREWIDRLVEDIKSVAADYWK